MDDSTKGPSQKLSKIDSDRIGRIFNLVFNRASMYGLNHPSTAESIEEFARVVREGLKKVSPLAIILDREQIYIEEERLDPRVNPFRLVSHLKKKAIQSVSFLSGLKTDELARFMEIFTDPEGAYNSAEQMKEALRRKMVSRVKINHVFFKKMTQDEEVVEKDRIPDHSEKGSRPTDTVPVFAKEFASGRTQESEAPSEDSEDRVSLTKAAWEEIEKHLTVTGFLKDPSATGKRLIEAELSSGSPQKGTEGASEPQGSILVEGLKKLAEKIEESGGKQGASDNQSMLQSAYKLKEDLLNEIEVQKAMGVVFKEEGMIRRQIDDLTDSVMIKLIKDEYRKGQISVKRLAQILRRMMPDVKELRRVLPKLKEALLAEGMPLADFLKLVQELGQELQSEGLAQVLQEAAEQIGLHPSDLYQEIKRDPRSAAELISLAAEIRQAGKEGDEKLLAELLVEYVERISQEMVLEEAEAAEGGGRQLREMISRIEDELLGSLKEARIQTDVLKKVDGELKSRVENTVDQLKSNRLLRHIAGRGAEELSVTSVVELIKETAEYEQEWKPLLERVRDTIKQQGVGYDQLETFFGLVAERIAEESRRKEPKVLPKGVLNRGAALFLLQGELRRAKRYKQPFSALLFMVERFNTKKLIPVGYISQEEVMYSVMERLAKTIRDVDYVGAVEAHKALVLLPMTDAKGAELARKRIKEVLEKTEFIVKDVPLSVKLLCSATSFDEKKTSTLNAFLKRLELNLRERRHAGV